MTPADSRRGSWPLFAHWGIPLPPLPTQGHFWELPPPTWIQGITGCMSMAASRLTSQGTFWIPRRGVVWCGRISWYGVARHGVGLVGVGCCRVGWGGVGWGGVGWGGVAWCGAVRCSVARCSVV